MTTTDQTVPTQGGAPKRRRRAVQLLIIAAAMIAPLLITGGTAEAHDHRHHHYATPCPNWSIDDVLNDLDGDWDRDTVTNGDEVFHSPGLNPCKHDSTHFCKTASKYCDKFRHVRGKLCHNGHWYWGAVNANPHGDWDHDGITNHHEAKHGANPCVRPCAPTAYHIDVDLNPHGDWDRDGRSNLHEVRHRTNPCVHNPAPRIHATPAPLPHVGGNNTHTHNNTTTHSHPHTGSHTHITPQAPVAPTCPHGYPYYHPHTGKCYANPI